MTKPLCIYHGNCADGFTAAWVVRKALGDVDFHAGVYQMPPPSVTGHDVILVDFSYKRPVLEQMARSARTITILDHHKTAAEDLAPFASGAYGHTSLEIMKMPSDEFIGFCGVAGCLPIRAVFDMERSGAGLTWDFFFPKEPRPALLNHIEDRDLWRFALPFTREIQANVFSYPYDFGAWDELMAKDPALLAGEGSAIERKHHKDIAELVGVVTRRMVIGGQEVPIANLPYTLTSDAGHLLARGKGSDAAPEFPFAGCYWDTPDGRVFSLRSTESGADVGEIAKQYGGGGHKHASGFRVPYGHDLAR